ncbi:RNA 2',3'-cyclic phosphodiesterase [Nitrosovibrio sp. Nv4]|uniref:RNA 2',3'-cyclic phosphodiesterase n=1 Tax=Nitrosovibrio sp. Nv4 TaxID=1945880 RepID=UPI000BDD57EC|nr:RNA 2',3'-cyclic phosphodiesterase [Nitrosovibrio sp. Nv4]SOD42521.1 2'-5' RNA ligase [Nitrosovibrio sp. Nv4]
MRTKDSTEIGRRTARVFFAIWPDSNAQRQLGGLVKRLQLEALCGGRKTKAENIHLTLVFVGEVEIDKLEILCRVAKEIRDSGARAFDLVVEKICYWKHKGIVYGEIGRIPQELMSLVTALQDGLSHAGFSLEQRAYRPHITLMRDASCQTLPELTEPIAWRACEWVLVKSEQTSDGSVYVPVDRWSLDS